MPPRKRRRSRLDPRGQALGLRAARERHGQPREVPPLRGRADARPEGHYAEKIAVIGSGVAGLTVAHDLARAGYKVTVFEADPVAGRNADARRSPLPAAPRAREGRDRRDPVARRRAAAQRAAWARRACTIRDLRAQGYKAFFIGAGLQGSRRLKIPGADLPGVVNGLEFLRLVNLGEKIDIGPRVLVIGGGNVAFDVARSALSATTRTRREDFRVTADVARTAARRAGVTEVHIACLESREEMPADAVEIEEGLHEGLAAPHVARAARRPRERQGRGVEFAACLSVFDSERRFNPKFDESHEARRSRSTRSSSRSARARELQLPDARGRRSS